ncbi:MAG: hypothetical protein AAFQ98_16555 [Bacteroidota bacterium]
MASDPSIPNPLAALGAELMASAQALLGMEPGEDMGMETALLNHHELDAVGNYSWFWEAFDALHSLPELAEETATSQENSPAQKAAAADQKPRPESEQAVAGSAAHSPTRSSSKEARKQEWNMPETSPVSAAEKSANLERDTEKSTPVPRGQRIGGLADFAQLAPMAVPALEESSAHVRMDSPESSSPDVATQLQPTEMQEHQQGLETLSPTASDPKDQRQEAKVESDDQKPRLRYPVRRKSNKGSLSEWAQAVQPLDEKSISAPQPSQPPAVGHYPAETRKPNIGASEGAKVENYPLEHASAEDSWDLEDTWADKARTEEEGAAPILNGTSLPVTGQSSFWNGHVLSEPELAQEPVQVEVAEGTESITQLSSADPESQVAAPWPEASVSTPSQLEWPHRKERHHASQGSYARYAEPEIPEIRRSPPTMVRSRKPGLKDWQDLRLNYRRRTGK